MVDIFDDTGDAPINLYAVEIVQSRYDGAYEGGRWLAFPNGILTEGALAAHGVHLGIGHVLPEGWYTAAFGHDNVCSQFWQTSPMVALIGRGETPNDALADLKQRYADPNNQYRAVVIIEDE